MNKSKNINTETEKTTISNKGLKLLFKIILPLLVIISWEIIAVWIDRPTILPKVESVFVILSHPLKDILGIGSLYENALVSIARVFLGFIIAAAVAIPLGIFIGYFKKVREFTNVLIELIRPIPPLAWIPLALAWFGLTSAADLFGIEAYHPILGNLQISMVFIIFIGAFFPILLSAVDGVKGVKTILIETAVTLGAKDKEILRKVIIPAASPVILTGLRIGIGIAWMCVVAAEMLPGSSYGLGYLISHAYDIARIDLVIAGMIIIGLIGILINIVIEFFEEKKFKWRSKNA